MKYTSVSIHTFYTFHVVLFRTHIVERDDTERNDAHRVQVVGHLGGGKGGELRCGETHRPVTCRFSFKSLAFVSGDGFTVTYYFNLNKLKDNVS